MRYYRTGNVSVKGLHYTGNYELYFQILQFKSHKTRLSSRESRLICIINLTFLPWKKCSNTICQLHIAIFFSLFVLHNYIRDLSLFLVRNYEKYNKPPQLHRHHRILVLSELTSVYQVPGT